MNGTTLRLSHSEMQTFLRCKRKWYVFYYLGYGPDPAAASPHGNALLGTRLHTALDAEYGHGLDGLRVLSYLYERTLDARPEYERELLAEQELATIMLGGFPEWAASEGFDAGYETIATEQQVEVPIPLGDDQEGPSLILMARLDAIIRRTDDGALLFRDWKSVGSFSKANGLQRDTQMRTYALIQALRARSNPRQPRVDGGQYVMLLRSKRTARAAGPFYRKEELPPYNNHDLNSAWLRTREIGAQILETRRRLDAGADHRSAVPATPITGNCDWECPASDICTLFDDGSRWEDALHGTFIKIDPYARYSDTLMDEVLAALSPG